MRKPMNRVCALALALILLLALLPGSVLAATTPGAIATVITAASEGQITVTWTASSGATAYIIQRRVKDSDTWTTLKSNVTGLSYEDTTGIAGTVYQYRVRGRSGSLFGPFKVSSVVRAQAGAAAPGAISSVTATAADGKITVTWTASANAAQYELQRRVYSGGVWSDLILLIHLLGIDDEIASVRSKLHTSSGSEEYEESEFGLKLLDSLRKCGLRNVQGFRRLVHRPQFRDRDRIDQLL